MGGARLKPQQAMVDKLVKEIDDANAVITKATVGIKTNERCARTITEQWNLSNPDTLGTEESVLISEVS